MLYLMDAGKGPEIATVSSVSGGSITNGWMAATGNINDTSADEFDDQASAFATKIALGGTLWADWMTYGLLALIAAIVIGAAALIWATNAVAAWIIVVGAAFLVGLVAKQRSRVVRHAFDSAMFKKRKLADTHSIVTHVMCAADLQTAETVYFSGDFVYSYRTGVGVPGDLSLSTAVQASACLPGAFNPVSLPINQHRFPKHPGFEKFLLTDGGAYDNMASEWILRVLRGFDHPRHPLSVDEAIVVNSSAPLDVESQGSVHWPVVGEITSLLAAKDVLYDQTTAVRRRYLNSLFVTDARIDGTIVQINRTPYDLPDRFIPKDDATKDDEAAPAAGEPTEDAKAARARAVVALLDGAGGRTYWKTVAEASAAVGTTLSRLEAERARDLIRHAYTVTMANCHVLLDYPLLPVPTDERTSRWVD